MIGTRDPTVESGWAPGLERRGCRGSTWGRRAPTRLPFGFGTFVVRGRGSRWGTNLRSSVVGNCKACEMTRSDLALTVARKFFCV
jgi:hypothetical protein